MKRATLCVLAGMVTQVAGHSHVCGGKFGNDLATSAGLHITVAEVGTGSGFPSNGPPLVTFASPGQTCLDMKPTGCERYFKWYYRTGCPAMGNVTIGAADGHRFDRNTGVLIECRPWAGDVQEFCYKSKSPGSNDVEPCQCPSTVLPPGASLVATTNDTNDVSGSGSGSDDSADRIIFTEKVPTDIVAVILFPSIAAVATTAGVGGGGIFVPLLIVMCGFSAKAATATSQALIFGACTAAFSANVRRQHPKAKRPLIDYELCLFLAPMEMAGALVGVIVNVMLPTWLLQALMVLILGYTAFKTFNKGLDQYRKEKGGAKPAAPAAAVELSGVGATDGVVASPLNTDDVEADVTLLGDILRGSRYMVDIREQKERDETGAIIAAQHAPMHQVLQSGLPDDVDRDAEIIVLGQEGGQHCQKVRDHLKSQGFPNVKVLKGGIVEWNRTVPTEFGTRQAAPIPGLGFIGARELARRSLLGKEMPYALDIRTTEERQADQADEILKLTLPDHHIPIEDILREEEPRLPDCEKRSTVLIVGLGHMQRAAKVYWKLREFKYTDVRVLRGGLKAWRELVGGGNELDEPTSPSRANSAQWQISRAASAPQTGLSTGWGASSTRGLNPASAVSLPASTEPTKKEVGSWLWKRAARSKEQILADEAVQYPTCTLMVLFAVWIFLIALIMVKGGKKTPSAIGLANCTGGYWGVWFLAQAFLIFVGGNYAMKAVVGCEEKELCGYDFLPTDIMWTHKKTWYVCVYAFGAGVIAGIMGIGGGMVLGPLMLQLGLDGRVSSSTTTTTIVMTSSSAVIAFFAAGAVPWTYAVTLCGACFFGALFGKRFLDAIVKKYNLTALIVLLLAGIIGGSTMFVLVLGSLNWNDMRESGSVPGFNPPC